MFGGNLKPTFLRGSYSLTFYYIWRFPTMVQSNQIILKSTMFYRFGIETTMLTTGGLQCLDTRFSILSIAETKKRRFGTCSCGVMSVDAPVQLGRWNKMKNGTFLVISRSYLTWLLIVDLPVKILVISIAL